MAVDEGTISLDELVPSEYERGPTRIVAVRWAGQFDDDNASAIRRFTADKFRASAHEAGTVTAEVYNASHDDWNKVNAYDWIIQGVQGELYPCERHVFAETYTRAATAGEFAALDRLKRHQLTGVPRGTAAALDDWLARNYGRFGSGHNVGDFLNVLREHGLGVFRVADRTT